MWGLTGGGWGQANLDVYATAEPQMQLHKRVAFCLDMHNQVYPPPLPRAPA